MTCEQQLLAERLVAEAIAREAARKTAVGNEEFVCTSMGDMCRGTPRMCADFDSTALEQLKERKRRTCSSRGPLSVAASLLGNLLPDPSERKRKPDLHAANLSFAARVIILVRDRFDNNAPRIYKAAYLSRKTYSAIISDEAHAVSKRTAIQLAFALQLSRSDADLLLHAAGYHLSRSVVEDMIFDACLEAGIHDLEDINTFLVRHECRPFVPQD